MSLSTLAVRADTLHGQIKQADANIDEAALRLQRADTAAAAAKLDHQLAVDRAAALRQERALMQAEAQELVGRIGEPPPVAGGEVSSSAGAGDADASPASCDHEGHVHYRPFNDDYECGVCRAEISREDVEAGKYGRKIFGDGPAPQYAKRA